MIHAPLAVVTPTSTPATVSDPDVFTDVLARYTLIKKLSSTLYGETALYRDEALGKKLVVLKRVSIPLLQQESQSPAVKENPLCERIVVQMLEDPLIARTPGREHVVEYVREGFFSSGDSVQPQHRLSAEQVTRHPALRRAGIPRRSMAAPPA
ncbi:hypothetical protein GQ600_12327 [Phytophthora cactorum]|nr:hypothetical protein GQ600_12327 [Phytophthora cactorum]